MDFSFEVESVFLLKEKILSITQDDFDVKDAVSGEVVYVVRASATSFRHSKVLYGVDGTALYKMKDATFTLRSRMYVEDCRTGETVLTLRKKSPLPIPGMKTVQIWQGGKDDGDPWLEIKGNIFKLSFKIRDATSKETVASVSKKMLNFSTIFTDSDSYVVTVQPGINTALMICLAIVVDERYHDAESESVHSRGVVVGEHAEGSGSSSSSSSGSSHEEEAIIAQEAAVVEEHEGSSTSSSSSSSSSSSEDEAVEQEAEEQHGEVEESYEVEEVEYEE